MRPRQFGAAIAIALLPAFGMAEEVAPAAVPAAASVAAADSASTQSAPAASQAPEAGPAMSDAPAPVLGKRWCDMKGKGMGGMAGMPGHPMGPGKPCGCDHGCDAAMHREMVQRLDMIEARLAKIEAMLESLMRR